LKGTAMPARFCLIFGLIAGAVFIGTSAVLGALLPNYDPVTQTISEIGERGSPFETTFKVANLFVTGCNVLLPLGSTDFPGTGAFTLCPQPCLDFTPQWNWAYSSSKHLTPCTTCSAFRAYWVFCASRPRHHLAEYARSAGFASSLSYHGGDSDSLDRAKS